VKDFFISFNGKMKILLDLPLTLSKEKTEKKNTNHGLKHYKIKYRMIISKKQ